MKFQIKTFSTIVKIVLTICTLSQSAPYHDSNFVKIIGGVEANPGEFPFIVSVQLLGSKHTSNSHLCGGTLVSMSRVITAAHCLPAHISQLAVVAGAHLLKEGLRGIQQLRQPKKITFHPNYDIFFPEHHDIAVIDLATPFVLNSTVSSLPYATMDQQYSGRCQIAGWGLTDMNNTQLSDVMMKTNVTINSASQCTSKYPVEFDPDHQICTGGFDASDGDSCEGDMGGPLVCSNSNGSKYFAGVTSWGDWNCKTGRTSVYMAIAKYRNWLDFLDAGDENRPTTTSRPSTTQRLTAKPNPELPTGTSSASIPKENQNEDDTESSNSEIKAC